MAAVRKIVLLGIPRFSHLHVLTAFPARLIFDAQLIQCGEFARFLLSVKLHYCIGCTFVRGRSDLAIHEEDLLIK